MTSQNNKLNWKLEKKLINKSIFDNKKMVEKTNIKLIYGFIGHNMGITYDDYKPCNIKTEREQIIKYKNLYNKKTELFETSHKLPKHKWGRILPTNYISLSVFHRPTRHALSKNYYMDIDMSNAQPTIIYEICKINNYDNILSLEKYVKNPKKYRELIMTHHNCDKDTAKRVIISIMNGGSYSDCLKWDGIKDNKNKKIKTISNIEDEMKQIINIIYGVNQHIKEDILKENPEHWKNEDEAKRGVMAIYCQSIERLIQETSIKWLCDHKNFNLEYIIPCQDGLMILKELWYDGILNDVSNIIKDTFNINISYVNKPFDEAIEIKEIDEKIDVNDWEDLLSCKKLADMFLELYGNYIIKYKSCVYVYWFDDKSGGRWYDETNKKERHKLILYISEKLFYYVKNLLDDAVQIETREKNKLLKILRNNTSKSSSINDIIIHILSNANETKTDFNNKPFLLGFDNGVYDLTTGDFRPYKYDDYITITTNYDYEPLEENKKLAEELDDIFDIIQPNNDHKQLLLQILASGLDGKLYQKLFLLNGSGGNGKGLISSLMKSILGGYAYQPSNGILKDAEKSNAPSPDIYNLKNKRYINFTEVSGLIKVSTLRNLTGGTTFTARLLNQNPESFKLNATFTMEFNNAPELDGKPLQADYRRLVDLYFPVNFTDDENKIDKIIGGVKYCKANPYYESEEFILSMRNTFLHKLLKVYKDNYVENIGVKFSITDDIRLRTEKFIENQNLFQKVFNELYIKVDYNEKDLKSKIIKIKDIWESIILSQEYKNISYREKRQYSREEFYKWIESVGFKVFEHLKTKCVVGIQRIDNIEDEDEITALDV